MESGQENSQSGCSTECAEGEEQDEPSSSEKVKDDLATFREDWKREIKESPKHHVRYHGQVTTNRNKEERNDRDSMAETLFLKGVEMERMGEMYEAIQFYRRAVQLVPDIEFRLDEKAGNKAETEFCDNDKANCQNFVEEDEEDDDNGSSDDSSDDEIKTNLLSHIERKINKQQCLCVPQIETNALHISALPTEIILYILRWVISSDLDLRSLEICSRVSRGFYLCCRDSEIWKSACFRVWGMNCPSLSNKYLSWREMFIERTRLNYNGCYISKTSYLRHGENSFQDQFYRPWHIVTYYRYLRFFPEGLVLMLTTADEPAQCVGQLKYRKSKSPAILSGHYRLKDDRVILVVQRRDAPKTNTMYKRNRKRDALQDSSEQTYHLEMQINNYKNQKHIQLIWTGYSIYTRNKSGTDNTSFEVAGNRFPPLWFSRVKSYTAESYGPLK